MHRTIKVVRGGLVCAALTWAISSMAPSAPAQDKNLHAGEGQERLILDKDWAKEAEELKIFHAYRKDTSSITITPEILDHAAQWFAYRFTHSDFQEPKVGGKGMHDLLKDALEQVVDPRGARKPTEGELLFKEQFDKRFVARLQEVTKNPKPIARVNAAIVLARIAATGSEDAVAVLLDIVKDEKENDGIKLWAFRGIKDFFSLGQGDNPNPFRNKDREARCIAALLDYLGRKSTLSDLASPQEKAAVPYIRKEAIAALGETRYPGYAKTENKKTTIERPTAFVLMRYMRKDGVDPVPTTEEQANAAVGLCRLRSRALEQYHVDYTAEQLGWFIVEFCTSRNSDQQNALPWKLLASRLSKALEDFRADVQGRQEAKYVVAVADKADDLLKTIIEAKGDSPNPEGLAAWLEKNKPPKALVYEGVPDAVIHTAGRATQ
jgi:hypothetical protein